MTSLFGFELGDYQITLCDVPPDAEARAEINGPPVEVDNTALGQNAYVTFDAQPGDVVTVLVEAFQIQLHNVLLVRPDGTTLRTGNQFGWNVTFRDVTLPDAGTYRVYIDPLTDELGTYTVTVTGAAP